jgi:prepilin-type N-terminal cleavage/methylation domain-containing protein
MNNRYFAIRVRSLSLPHGKQVFRNRRGNATPHTAMVFTLIELMLVVTIISILAALLLPALKRAKAVAWTSVCANNMKQHYLSVLSFADEHDDYLPCTVSVIKEAAYVNVLFPTVDQTTGLNYPWWRSSSSNLFYPYITPLQKSQCPAYQKKATDFAECWETYRINGMYMSSSSFLAALPPGRPTDTVSAVKKRFSQAPHPSELFLFVDSSSYTWGMDFSNTGYGNIGFHHNGNGGFNANYFDGHVEFLPLNHAPLTANDPPLKANNFQ